MIPVNSAKRTLNGWGKSARGVTSDDKTFRGDGDACLDLTTEISPVLSETLLEAAHWLVD